MTGVSVKLFVSSCCVGLFFSSLCLPRVPRKCARERKNESDREGEKKKERETEIYLREGAGPVSASG